MQILYLRFTEFKMHLTYSFYWISRTAMQIKFFREFLIEKNLNKYINNIY